MEPISLRTPLALLLISLATIAAVWWWLATPITLVRAPIDPNAKLQCVSYAPFRGEQTPLIETTYIPAEQIAADLAQLAKVTDCVRTYSIDQGVDHVPELAAKVGLKVIQPHQPDHPAAQPDAFGVAGGAVDGLLGLDEFGRLALIVLGGLGGLAVEGVLALLVLGGRVAALGEGAAHPQRKGQSGNGEVTQDHTMRP